MNNIWIFGIEFQPTETFVRKRGGLDNSWQDNEIRAWLTVYEQETDADRRGERWKKFSAKLWREHKVKKTNSQCGSQVLFTLKFASAHSMITDTL